MPDLGDVMRALGRVEEGVDSLRRDIDELRENDRHASDGRRRIYERLENVDERVEGMNERAAKLEAEIKRLDGTLEIVGKTVAQQRDRITKSVMPTIRAVRSWYLRFAAVLAVAGTLGTALFWFVQHNWQAILAWFRQHL